LQKPLPSEHWLMKSSPFLQFQRESIEARSKLMKGPILGTLLDTRLHPRRAPAHSHTHTSLCTFSHNSTHERTILATACFQSHSPGRNSIWLQK
jgi:hypothetical protein